MASDVLFERNCCSTSVGTLKAASSTPGDNAFHTEVLPAKWVNTGLQYPAQKQSVQWKTSRSCKWVIWVIFKSG